MTNEMQLAQAAGLPITGQDIALGHSNGQGPKHTGLKRIHRLLRGRYPAVITLGVLFGIAGALIGFLAAKPLFSSDGEVLIDPTIQTPNSYNGEEMSSYGLFLESQPRVIKSYEVVQRALDEDEWKNAGGMRGGDAAMARFAGGLEVENLPNTAILRITYSDSDPNLAYAGAQAIIKAYGDFFRDEDPLLTNSKLGELEREKTKYTSDLQNDQIYLSSLQKVYGTDDLTSYQSVHMAAKAQLAVELENAKMQLDMDQQRLGNPADGSSTRPSLTEDQIAQYDGGHLNSLRSERDLLQQKLDTMRGDGYLSQSVPMQQLQNQINVINDEISSYIRSVAQNDRLGNGLGLTPLRDDIVSQKVLIADLAKRYEHEAQICADIGQYSEPIRTTKDDLQRAQAGLDTATAEIDRLNSLRDLNGSHQMQLISQPVLSSDPSTDRRKIFGVFGLLAGAAFPTGVILLIGLLDTRFRYSDEANTDLGGIPLLGILPNLPDLLTDPMQAATAAHCVHQIRTILQITAHSAERRVFTVTSASPGDGKTSLTLALGLSFAASGSRTLLVDGDLIGGGLTARLNVTAEHGVLEAMASRDITPFIRTTDVADLSFLPVGKAMGGYTGTISPSAVRRLVDEARKQFDVILIDTGPILGSIEASPVAVASDGVVLCVSRGQQRQLVDRSLAHLHAIGARLAGVVFNRAQSHDFERSTNRLGLGSIPAGADGRRSEAIGPVARAVASSVRSAASQDR